MIQSASYEQTNDELIASLKRSPKEEKKSEKVKKEVTIQKPAEEKEELEEKGSGRELNPEADDGCFNPDTNEITIGSKSYLLSTKMKCEFSDDTILKDEMFDVYIDFETEKLMGYPQERLRTQKSKDGTNVPPSYVFKVNPLLGEGSVLDREVVLTKDKIVTKEPSVNSEWNRECEMCETLVKVSLAVTNKHRKVQCTY